MPGFKKISAANYEEFCALNPHLQIVHDKKRNAFILSRRDGIQPKGLYLKFAKTDEARIAA
ncbi:MAG TPA: hypothetical protein VFZ34_11200 [Blastocatellia bacterium]|nr:hypothetical protein [Blastocatellia bacterium]